MKSFILKFATILVLLGIYSKFGPSLPISVVTQDKGQPLYVEGQGKAVVKPDTAVVTAGIEVEGDTLEAVQEEASERSQTLVSAIKDLGIDEDDIKTSSYNVYPQYSFEGETQQIIGYRVSTQYQIKVRDIEIVNEVLAGVTANGANTVGGVSFEVSDEAREEFLSQAREEAAEKARAKAESLAKATGVRLGRVLSVTEYETGDGPMPYAMDRMAEVQTLEGPTLPEIPTGETELTITVSMSFEIR